MIKFVVNTVEQARTCVRDLLVRECGGGEEWLPDGLFDKGTVPPSVERERLGDGSMGIVSFDVHVVPTFHARG